MIKKVILKNNNETYRGKIKALKKKTSKQQSLSEEN